MTATSGPPLPTCLALVPDSAGHPRPTARSGGGLLGIVAPNSPLHWTLLIVGLASSVVFNATYLIAGALRPGYDWLQQPISALSLGPGGGVQTTDFIACGVLGCLTAFAWRPTLTPGVGVVWIPRLLMLAAVALICTGVFTQDPALGFPREMPSLASPSIHALIHNLVSTLSLAATIAGLLILARRFTREPHWRGWSTAALVAGVLMMAFLTTFVALITHAGPGGVFEKLAALTPTLFGLALTTRLLRARDARVSTTILGLTVEQLKPSRAPGNVAQEVDRPGAPGAYGAYRQVSN